MKPCCNTLKTKIKTRSKKSFKLSLFVLVFFIFNIFTPIISKARTFNPNNIITNDELLDYNDLSRAAIQTFLEREGSVLARYSQIINGETKKASEMIWEVAQKHKVSSKFILTTLEKEQALIHSSQATEKALDWATGYSCYGGTCNEKHRGFYNQIEASAETQRIYMQKASQFGFRVGVTSQSYDGYNLTPANQATANLYVYTPYVGYSPELGVTAPYGGNRLFWRIWHRYFSNQKFLDGQVVTNGGNYWLIENNKKRKFDSKELFLKDYDLSEAIPIFNDDLAAYPNGKEINFANNTLVKSSASGQIYLLADGWKRPIVNNSALALLTDFHIAVTGADVPVVSEDEIEDYQLGALINTGAIYPQGKLFKDETGKIWQIKDGLKHEVDPAVWKNRFDSETPEIITSSQLEKYPTGSPIKLKDGTFVIGASSGTYYLISQGARMKIEDLTIFNRVFGIQKKNNALKVSTALLENHDAGDVIDYIDDTIKDPITTTPATPVTSSSYSGQYISMTPDGLIMMTGQSAQVTLNFKNMGGTNWQNRNVYLKVTDKGETSSSFGVPEKIYPNQGNISASQTGSFSFEITAPTEKSGLLTQEFGLYYDKNGVPIKITSVSKFIIVKAGESAQVIDHNIPVAVKNNWRPVPVTMKIQNNGTETVWLSNKTALEIYNVDGTTSDFYDPNDWVRSNIAAVPVNKSYIKPGEIGEFKFTIDPRGINPGFHILNFKLNLLDQDKEIYLNGGLEWHLGIRVD